MAKVLGTVISLAGALCPRVLNSGLQSLDLSTDATNKNWVVGSFLLLVCCCCWSFWLILQETICKHYNLEPLSLATWMCLLSTFMSAALTFFFEPNLTTWKITSLLQLFSSLFALGGCCCNCECLYTVLWGKSADLKPNTTSQQQQDDANEATSLMDARDEALGTLGSDLTRPLISERSNSV